MSIAEILEQIRALSREERELLLAEIQMMQSAPAQPAEPQEHWGQALNRLMDEIGPIELKYPEIEDPVEWVKHLRAARR